MGSIVLDLNEVPDAEDFSPLPDGEYLCLLDNVEEKTTKESGHDMWNLKWKVADGDFENRVIFDRLIFSPKGLKRVKLILSRIGFEVSQPLNLTPESLQGALMYISVHTRDYTKDDGQVVRSNEVDFAGYRNPEAATVAHPPARPAPAARATLPPARAAAPPPRSAPAPAQAAPPVRPSGSKLPF